MTGVAVAWAAALDQLEELNRRREAFLDGQGPRPSEEVGWAPPAGPLPEPLRVRARLATDRSLALEERVRALVARNPMPTTSPYS